MRIKLFKRTALCFVLAVAFGSNLQGQISGGELKPDKEPKVKGEKVKKEKTAFNRDSLSGVVYYIGGMGQWSYRKFEDQTISSIYVQEAEEVPFYASGINLGTVMPLTGRLGLEVGLAYFGHAEAYNYSDPDSDSTFHYSNSYLQAGIPLKLRYTYGDDVQFFGYAGLTPLNVLSIRRKTSYTRMDGTTQEEEITAIKQGFTAFNLMATGGIGVNYYFLNRIGLSLSAEYRRHLMNTYSESTLKRDHKMYGVGLNLSLQVRF